MRSHRCLVKAASAEGVTAEAHEPTVREAIGAPPLPEHEALELACFCPNEHTTLCGIAIDAVSGGSRRHEVPDDEVRVPRLRWRVLAYAVEFLSVEQAPLALAQQSSMPKVTRGVTRELQALCIERLSGLFRPSCIQGPAAFAREFSWPMPL